MASIWAITSKRNYCLHWIAGLISATSQENNYLYDGIYKYTCDVVQRHLEQSPRHKLRQIHGTGIRLQRFLRHAEEVKFGSKPIDSLFMRVAADPYSASMAIKYDWTLGLASDEGITVAHIIALCNNNASGGLANKPETLKLEDGADLTVERIMGCNKDTSRFGRMLRELYTKHPKIYQAYRHVYIYRKEFTNIDNAIK